MSTKRISIAEIILWLFVFALIVISLTPLALGFKIKSDYSLLINDLSEMSQVEIQLIGYEQGFFSSDAVLAVSVPNLEEQLQFKENIIHGPVYLGLISQGKSPFVAAVVKGQLDVSPSQEDLVEQIFAGNNPLVYQTTIDFSGDLSAQFYIPSVDTSFEDEFGPVHIQSAGVIMNEHYSSTTGLMNGDMQMPVFKVESEVLTMKADSISMSFSGSMGGNDIMIGDSVISMNLLNIDSGEDQFAVRDLVVRSVTSENAGLINSNSRVEARELLASNQKFGPLILNMSVNGINAESLNQLQDMQTELEEKLQQGLPPEQINAMMTGQIMAIIPDLIKQAEIKVNPLSVDSELGKLEADLDFTLEGIDSDTPADPMFLLGAINLDLNFSIDEQLLKQFVSWELENNEQADVSFGSDKNKKIESDIPLEQKVAENIQGMLDENWLVMNEGVYLSKISMHQGELIINEKAVDPMKQIMSSMGGAAPVTP
ncbi:MAG: YdgA family protein [Gammaproteobacteria bacterium]|nr:YdgA family protein [Gammaproteobacteria bacterium]